MSAWEELAVYLDTRCVAITSDPDKGNIDSRKVLGALKFLCEKIDELKTTRDRDNAND